MKKRIYEIVLDSPIGLKKGSLTLSGEGGACAADIYLMRHWNRFAARRTGPGGYSLRGALWTQVGEVACEMELRVEGEGLSAVADTAKGRMKLTGRLAEKAKTE